MNRTETTKFLTDILVTDRLSDRKYFAKEVSVDYGTDHTKRVDVMQFVPEGVIHASSIEKGVFICYEIKSCKADIYSGNGLNFLGEKNYIVTTMKTYKDILPDITSGHLVQYVKEHFPESSTKFGFMVPVPVSIDCRSVNTISDEIENSTHLGGSVNQWKMHIIYPAHPAFHNRSIVELLFCMLRSKHTDPPPCESKL